MSLFGEILSECNLLLEKTNIVTDDKIKDAIENCKIVSIMYNDGEKNGGKSWRYIYPVVFGELKNGNKAIRAYQDGGSTSRIMKPGTNKGKKRGWKLFRLDRIVAWFNQENTETDLSHVFNPETLADLNKTGDKSFRTIYVHSPAVKIEPVIDSDSIDKSDIQTAQPKQDTNKEPAVKYVFNPEWKNQYKEKSQEISVDNSGNVGYTSSKEANKMEAPETKPVTKDDVAPDEAPMQPKGEEMPAADETPVTKDEVNGKVENDITTAFQDIMKRMENAESKS